MVAAHVPSATFVFVGQDWEEGEARREVDALGLSSRVRFLGHQPDSAFDELLGAVDVGVSLRRPPTYGETSAALLDLLRHGVPTIVTDVGTFADYPDDVVRKVSPREEGLDELVEAMRMLATDRDTRRMLGEAALTYVIEKHDWSRTADGYASLLESLYARDYVRRKNRSRSHEGAGR